MTGGRPNFPPPAPPPPPSPGSQSPWSPEFETHVRQQVPNVAQPSAFWPLTVISFLCSFLIGGVAMYFSAQVGNKWKAGDVAGARKASQVALIVGIVGIAVGLIILGGMASLSGGESSY